MRFSAVMIGMAALFAQTEAAHAVSFAISGTASGTSYIMSPCSTGICSEQSPYTHVFGFVISTENDPRTTLTINGNIYNFTYGISFNDGFYSGSFRSLGSGAFEGISLNYAKGSGCYGSPCLDASTQNFTVRQTVPVPVPEPVTWALMLVGFGGVSAAMRRRNRMRVTYA